MITDNCYQSMFMVYQTGVVVIDAPTSYAQYIPKAIAEVTNKPVKAGQFSVRNPPLARRGKLSRSAQNESVGSKRNAGDVFAF